MIVSLAFVTYVLLAVTGSNVSKDTAIELVSLARESIQREDPDEAFLFLSQAYEKDSSTTGLMQCFEDVFRLRIKLGQGNVLQERMGLSSILVDQQRHEEAAKELRVLIGELSKEEDQKSLRALKSKAASMLFRSQSAVCHWKNYRSDKLALKNSVDAYFSSEIEDRGLPPVHAFEALKWPCISLANATAIAQSYGSRAARTKRISSYLPQRNSSSIVPFVKVSKTSMKKRKVAKGRKIRLGYISPDFTGKHPLAFLMQDVFRLHNFDEFDVFLYSLMSNDDDSPEVLKIRNATNNWKVFSAGQTSDEIAASLQDDDLDILIDLCGYTGTFVVSEIMAQRVAPTQISYMGYPGSTGASYIDYIICDQVVVPPDVYKIRKYYTEYLLTMPHSYFVNSHKYIGVDYCNVSREQYGLPSDGFVYACHSRPDKIDPSTFRSWLRALSKLRNEGIRRNKSKETNAVLWLLKSGIEMEKNLRKIARDEFGLTEEALIFADVAPRQEHLHRLSLADLFLDTPAYNAHTVGCDTLYAGVPMVSLLREDREGKARCIVDEEEVPTQKLASRVGASLLKAANLSELVSSTMPDYEAIMIRCAMDEDKWYSNLRSMLQQKKDILPLFDTGRWVNNLETGLIEIFDSANCTTKCDIYVEDVS